MDELEFELVVLRMVTKAKKLTIGLFSGQFFNVESPSLSVNALDLAFSTFAAASHNLNGVSLTDGNCTDVVLGSQILAQVGAHDLSS